MRRFLLPLTYAILLVSLVACAPAVQPENTATPQPAPAPAPAPAPSPSVSSEPTPRPTTAPALSGIACADLISDERAQTMFDSTFVPVTGAALEQLAAVHIASLGPVAQASFAEAAETLRCAWGRPDSGLLVKLFVAELPTATLSNLVAELRKSDYVQSFVGDIEVFTYTVPGTIPSFHHFGFRGNTWVAAEGTLAGPAIEEVFARLYDNT